MRKLLAELPPDQFTYYERLYPLKPNGEPTEVDHLLVSRYGVFVIETKNIAGKIFGKTTDLDWTVRAGRGTHTLYNPLRQNRTHVSALSKHLDLDWSRFHSIVCFASRRSSFGTRMPANVVREHQLVPLITSHTDVVIDESEEARILNRVNRLIADTDSSTEARHLEEVQARTERAKQVVG